MKVLVTGAAGFIGSSLCDRLLEQGNEVVGVDCLTDYYDISIKRRNLENARSSENFTFLQLDLATCDLPRLLEGVSAVFHQAGQPGVRASWGSEFEGYVRNNILATQRLLEACRDQSGLRTLVAASSSSVYGTAERYPTIESDMPTPISPYGVTKLAAEHLCTLYGTQFGVPCSSLRYFTVYGPRQRPDMAINRLIRSALTGSQFPLYGSGEQRRDFTFIDDIVRANLEVSEWLMDGGSPGSVFNVGSGNPVSLHRVIATIESVAGRRINCHHLPPEDGDPIQTGADCTRITSLVGWRPQISFEDGIAAQVQALSRATY